MMRTPLPRPALWKGHVLANAFLLDVGIGGEAHVAKRVLSMWQPGVEVRRHGSAILVMLPQPQRVDVRTAPGLPLVQDAQHLLGVSLDAQQKASLPAMPAVITLKGGQLHTLSLAMMERVDVAQWVDVGGVVLVVHSLGVVASVAPPETARHTSVRQVFGNAPTQAPGATEFERVMAARASPQGKPWPSRMWEAVLKAFSNRPTRGTGTPGTSTALVGSHPSSSAPAEQVERAARNWLTRWLLTSQVARFLGQRQAQYLMDMVEMFERGDLDSALKHAIPISKLPAKELADIALGVPSPRQTLRLGGARSTNAPGTSLQVSPDMMALLRQHYQTAFQRLVHQGKIDDAAFVLAELLDAPEAAVAFLEKHQRLELAAQLAEARELPAGLVVRQWFLAGDVERAVALARRHGAFADAVVRLERSNPAGAARLRDMWSRSLASAGQYGAAVEAAWPVKTLQAGTVPWLDKLAQLGGVAGAAALVRKHSLETPDQDAVRASILSVLRSTEDEDAAARREIALELPAQPIHRGRAVLAKAAVRALWRDAQEGLIPFSQQQARRLMDAAQDPVLKADAVPFPNTAPAPLTSRTRPLELERNTHDRGGLPIKDAHVLPDGRLLVALGEAGLRLLSRDGKTCQHWDVPAHGLVTSTGAHVLAVAQRGDALLVHRVDLAGSTVTRWLEVEAHAVCRTFDGAGWVVAMGQDLVCLDVQAPRPQALWRVSRVDGGIDRVDQAAGCVALLTGGERWMWMYSVPEVRLQARAQLPPLCAGPSAVALCAPALVAELALVALPGMVPQVWLGVANAGSVRRQEFTVAKDMPKRMVPGQLGAVTAGGGWIACAWPTGDGVVVKLLDEAALYVRTSIRLEGRAGVRLKLQDGWLVVADDVGGVMSVSLPTAQHVRSWRVV